MKEIWKDIPGYVGSYQVSDRGRVRGLDRLDVRGRKWKGKILGLRKCSHGYLRAYLYLNKVSSVIRVHRLVLLTFVGPCPKGMESCHGDGIKSNNCLTNLRWGTPLDESLERLGQSGIDAAESGKRLREVMPQLDKYIIEGTSEMEGQPVGLLDKPDEDIHAEFSEALTQDLAEKMDAELMEAKDKHCASGDGYYEVNIQKSKCGRHIIPTVKITVGGNEIKQVDHDAHLCGVFQKQIKIYDGTLSKPKDIAEAEASRHMNDAVRRELKLGRVDGNKVETQYAVYTWKADKVKTETPRW
jgi:hypothetical protein